MTTYRFQRGETISLALDVTEGSAEDVTAITAKMRQTIGGRATAEFVVTPRAAAGDVPAGWNLTIADSSALAVGAYSADARIEIALTQAP